MNTVMRWLKKSISVGTLLAMTDRTGTYSYGHDDLYRLTKVTLPSGKFLSYSYNDQGLRTGMTDYEHKNYVYAYDRNNRLQTLTLPGKEKVEYAYDPLSALSKVSYPNKTYTAYRYNDMERLTKLSTMKKGIRDRLVSEFIYRYDHVGNRTGMEENLPCGAPRTTAYSYDSLYRLASVLYPDKSQEDYNYDAAGNRTVRATKRMRFTSCFKGWHWEEKGCRDFVRCLFHPTYVTATTRYTYDTANKLVALSETELRRSTTHDIRTVTNEFDYNGNQIKESVLNEGCTNPVENTFGYDYENRLTSAVMKGIKQYSFVYNGEGKRISTAVSDVERAAHQAHHPHHALSRCGGPSTPPAGPVKETQHLYDGSSLVMDVDAKDRVIASYSYGLGLTGITSPAMKGYYHGDALGSITEITGKEGNALRSYRYGAWGEMTSGETSHDVNPFRYVGAYGVRWQDATLGMYHMGARWYTPGI